MLEILDRSSRTIELHKKLKEENLSIEDVQALGKSFAGKRRRVNQLEDEIVKDLGDGVWSPLYAQQAMNQVAWAELDVARAQLKKVEVELSWLLTPEESENYSGLQKAWGRYADLDAKFEALGWEGGSAHPLIYAGARTALTIRRIAELQQMVETRKQSGQVP